MKKLIPMLLCLLLLAGCGSNPTSTTPSTEAAEPPLTFQDIVYSPETTILTATSLTEGDIADLTRFPNLTTLNATGCTDQALLLKVKAALPQLDVICKVNLNGTTIASGTPLITLDRVSAQDLEEVLPLLPSLKKVTLTECVDADAEALLDLMAKYEDLTLDFSFTLEGLTIHSLAEMVDFSNIQIADLDTLERIVTKMPNITTVEMHHCGIDNEVMDALNRRYEDIKFIWSVYVARMYLRTDTEAFIPIKHGKVVYDYDLVNLKYCTDMRAIDLGHQIVTHCDWARYMTKLEFFLCADTMLASIEPLTGLEHLKYVEIFITNVKDYAPLLTLPALEDLNICWTYGDAEILVQMPYLKRLWWAGKWFRPEERELIVNGLPDTLLNLDNGESTGAGWRQHPNYFEMRDLLGMHYMG